MALIDSDVEHIKRQSVPALIDIWAKLLVMERHQIEILEALNQLPARRIERAFQRILRRGKQVWQSITSRSR